MISSTKYCSKCQTYHSVENFHKDRTRKDGHFPYCRTCRGTLSRQSAPRSDKPYKERRREISRRYKRSDKGKKSTLKHVRNYQARYPEKRKAHHAIATAVAAGILMPADSQTCFECGGQARQYHHYLGYAEEHHLDVVPVCLECHTRLHS